MRRSTLSPAFVLCTTALLVLLTAGAASAQVVGTLPTGGTTAIRTCGTEGASAPTAPASVSLASLAARWFATTRWWISSPARAVSPRVEWAVRRKAGR